MFFLLLFFIVFFYHNAGQPRSPHLTSVHDPTNALAAESEMNFHSHVPKSSRIGVDYYNIKWGLNLDAHKL